MLVPESDSGGFDGDSFDRSGGHCSMVPNDFPGKRCWRITQVDPGYDRRLLNACYVGSLAVLHSCLCRKFDRHPFLQ